MGQVRHIAQCRVMPAQMKLRSGSVVGSKPTLSGWERRQHAEFEAACCKLPSAFRVAVLT